MKKIYLLLALLPLLSNAQIQLDPSFGNNGITFIGDTILLYKLNKTPDGKLIGVGYKPDYTSDTATLLLSKISYNGNIDNGFGNSGILNCEDVHYEGSFQIFSNWIQILNGNGIFVNDGYIDAPNQFGYDSITLRKYLFDGMLDNNFGNSGKAKYGINGYRLNVYYSNVSQQGIVLTGLAVNSNPDSAKPFIIKCNLDGTLDNNFGNNGVLISNSFLLWSSILSNNKIVSIIGNSNGLGMIRLLPNGNFDTSFNGNDTLYFDFTTDEIFQSAILLNNDNVYFAAVEDSSNNIINSHLVTIDAINGVITNDYLFPNEYFSQYAKSLCADDNGNIYAQYIGDKNYIYKFSANGAPLNVSLSDTVPIGLNALLTIYHTNNSIYAAGAGISGFFITKIFPFGPNGINETQVVNQLKIFPNPASTTLQIENPANVNFDGVRFIDVNGKVIAYKKYNNLLDVSDIADGFYIAEFVDKGKVAYRNKLVVKK